jgi:hypothetical protein
MSTQVWDLWYPNAGAQGLSFARGRLDTTDRLLVHASPDALRVEVQTDTGELIAFGDQLKRTEDSPMTLLERSGKSIMRRDLWPNDSHVGLPVIFAGGEVGVLLSWWNSDARDEWRWRVELFNHK